MDIYSLSLVGSTAISKVSMAHNFSYWWSFDISFFLKLLGKTFALPSENVSDLLKGLYSLIMSYIVLGEEHFCSLSVCSHYEIF